MTPTTPLFLRPRLIGLVALGGAIGTGIREALALSWPAASTGFPLTILVINVVGSLALGLLLESLTRRGPDEGGRRNSRLFVGTGILGGFTTYSSWVTDIATRLGPAPGVALAYAAASLVLGFVAALAGIALAARLRPAS